MPGRPPKLALLRDPYCIGAAGQGPCTCTDRGAEEGQAEAAGHRGLSRNQKPTPWDAHHPPPWRRRGRHEDGLHPSLGSELTTCLICRYSTDTGGPPSSCPSLLPLPAPRPSHTHVCTHTHTHILRCTLPLRHTRTCVHTHVHSHTHTCLRARTYVCTHT